MTNHSVKIALIILLNSLFLTSQSQDTNSFDRVTILSTPRHIAFADMNKDGIQDMVGVNGNTNTNVEIYLGTGDGSFELTTTLDGSSGLEYYKVFLEHLNSDGFPDIIAVSSISGIVFISDDEGNYLEVSMAEIESENGGNATLFEDFDGDMDLDMFYNSRVHLNDGDGTSFTVIDRMIGEGGLIAFDYDSDIDQNLDLVVANSGSGKIQFFTGQGDGNFSANPVLELNGEIDRMISNDFNEDGLLDIIVHDFIQKQFIIYFNDANHLFTESTTIELNHSFFSVLELGDFDLDGSTDIIGSDDDNTMHYWPVAGDGSIGQRQEFETGTGSIREFHIINAIGEDFVDLVIGSGFGTTYLYSDKLNVDFTQIADSKVYDNMPFIDFYESSNTVSNVTVDYVAFSESQSDVGNYSVEVTAVDDNYEGSATFDVQITKRALTVTALDAAIIEAEPLPEFELEFENFATGDDQNSLISIPIASTDATENSTVGEYDIILSGGEALNYSFELINGILTIEEPLSISNNLQFHIYPNPASGTVKIESDQIIKKILLIDLKGKVTALDFRNDVVGISDIGPGLYFLKIEYGNESETIKLLIE